MVIFSKDAFTALTGNGWIFLYYIAAVLVLEAVNIPIYRNKENDVIGMNVGGALIPATMALVMAGLLLMEMDIGSWMLSVVVVTLLSITVAHFTSEYIPGVGVISYCITLPIFVAIMIEVVMLGLNSSAVDTLQIRMMLGFCASTVGAIVGCDVFKLPDIANDRRRDGQMSMGGAGIFDNVFTTGILTMGILLWIG